MAFPTRFSSRTVLGVTRARQGRSGRPIVWVLVFGLALTVLGFFAAYAWKADDLASTEVNNAREPQDAQVFDAPSSPAVLTHPPPAPVGG